MGNGPVEIVDLPMKNGESFHSYVSLPEGIYPSTSQYHPLYIHYMPTINHHYTYENGICPLYSMVFPSVFGATKAKVQCSSLSVWPAHALHRGLASQTPSEGAWNGDENMSEKCMIPPNVAVRK